MTTRIRVTVVDDHPLFREGVVQIMSACSNIDVVAQGASAKDAVDLARNCGPDITVLDISIPGGGFAALEEIVACKTATKVMMLTVSANEADVVRALRLGACGYVVKGVGGPELIHAIRSVHNGELYLSPSLGAKLVASAYNGEELPPVAEPAYKLSDREMEIFALLKLGRSNKGIGAKLQLSDKTVKHYMTKLFQKLQVRNRVEAAMVGSRVRRVLN